MSLIENRCIRNHKVEVVKAVNLPRSKDCVGHRVQGQDPRRKGHVQGQALRRKGHAQGQDLRRKGHAQGQDLRRKGHVQGLGKDTAETG